MTGILRGIMLVLLGGLVVTPCVPCEREHVKSENINVNVYSYHIVYIIEHGSFI